MVHSYGYKCGTRHMFQKKFRKHGVPAPAKSLTIYKVGDYVDVVADPSVRKGMPHKYYHGKTGVVWNVTPRGVGVIVNKPVNTRTLRKRICVRAEHVRPSKCRVAFVNKVKGFQERQKALKAGKPAAPLAVSKRNGGIIRKPVVEKLVRRMCDFSSK